MSVDVLRQRTMTTLQDMRAAAAAKLTDAEELQAAIDGEDRDWTPDEEQQYAGLLANAEELRVSYEQEQRRVQREGRREAVSTMRTGFNAIPDPQQAFSRGVIPSVTRMRAMWQDDPQWGFRGHGDFALAIYNSTVQGMRDERLDRVAQYQAALDHNIPQSGGLLLPPAHNTTIYNHMMGARTNLMALCDRYPLTGNLTIELIANAETSRVAGSRWGGVSSNWTEDGTTVTDSQPKVRMIELRPRQLATLVKVTNTLLANSSALEAFLDQAAVDDQIQTINAAIMRGDGVAKPKGFLTSGGLVTITKESGQAAATIVQQNILKMWARCLEEEQALWLVNRDTMPQIGAIAASGAAGTIPVMLAVQDNWPTMAVPGPMMLEGRPIRRLEQCSTLGTVGDIVLANMGGYALAFRARGDSVGTADSDPAIQKDMSMHLEFDKNRTAFRYLIAVDGQTWLQSAITPEQGSSTLADFVVIETRS
jgi:HK97 family phage major capsid protein